MHVHWYRRGLRSEDNRVLARAAFTDEVLPVFILPVDQRNRRQPGEVGGNLRTLYHDGLEIVGVVDHHDRPGRVDLDDWTGMFGSALELDLEVVGIRIERAGPSAVDKRVAGEVGRSDPDPDRSRWPRWPRCGRRQRTLRPRGRLLG